MKRGAESEEMSCTVNEFDSPKCDKLERKG